MDTTQTSVALVGCVITDDAGRLLLLHRSEPNHTQWELPGGKLDGDDEPLVVGAAREMMEELGVDVIVGEPLGQTEFDEGETHYVYHWFAATIQSGTPVPKEADRYDRVQYFSLDEMRKLKGLSVNLQAVLRTLLEQGAVSV